MRFILALARTLPIFGEVAKTPIAEAVHTEKAAFGPGGTIHIDGSDAEVIIEGWDRPEVEVTVTKLRGHDEFQTGNENAHWLENMGTVLDHKSSTDLTISTKSARRPHETAHDANNAYEIHVPRDSRLEIQYGVGFVQVGGLTGNIEAHVRRGDILLILPDSQTYAIDAKTRLGTVSSDFEGHARSAFLLGRRFERNGPAADHHLYLRMGFGGITIKGVAP